MRRRLFSSLRSSALVLFSIAKAHGAFAQTGTSVSGLEGGNEFLIPIGARGIGAAQAIVARGVGSEAIWWNPALVARGPREVAFNLAQQTNGLIVADVTAAVLWPVPHVGAFGLTARYINEGDQTSTTDQGEFRGTLTFTGVMVAGTFAAPFGDRLAAGLTLKFLQLGSQCTGSCDLPPFPPRTGALDFGAQYFVTRDSTITIGASTLNFGLPLQVNDSPQADNLPRRVDIGIAIAPKFSQLPKGIDTHAELDAIKAVSGGGPGYLFGAELAWQDQYAARVGYQRNGPTGSGPTFGLGFASGKLHVDFAQILTDAGTGSGKPTYLSLRYVF
jgi:hypothetical protein